MNLYNDHLCQFFSESFYKTTQAVGVEFNTILDSIQEATINQAILLKTPY